MTPEEIEEIRERARKVDEGPWAWSPAGEKHNIGGLQLARFIAHARTDIPKLLTALEEAEARVGELAEERDEIIQVAAVARDSIEELDARVEELKHICPKHGTMMEVKAVSCPDCTAEKVSIDLPDPEARRALEETP